jgi:hypothetical protein
VNDTDGDLSDDSWISELSAWLGSDARPLTLASSDLVTLLDEIQHLEDDPDATAWKALHYELIVARTLLGPEMLHALELPLGNLLRDARALDTKAAKSVAAVRRDAENLLATVTTGEVASYAWNDLVASVKDRDQDISAVQWRRDLVAELAHQRGRDWEEQANLAKGVLADRAWDILTARVVLDHPSREPFDPPEPDTRAGLSADERCALAEAVFDAPPRVGHHVVWVAFERAQLHQFPSIAVGSVTFHDGGRIRDILEHEAGDDRLPVELRSRWVHFSDIPDTPKLVLARVDLGEGVFVNPVRQATEHAQALVQLACFRANVIAVPVWRMLSGAIHAVDDEIVSKAVFRTAADDEPWHEVIAVPSYTLADLSRDLGDRDLSSSVQKLSSGLAWLQRSTTVEPQMGLLLAVRVVEMLSQEARVESWPDYLDRYFSAAWIRHQIKAEIGRSVRKAVGRRHTVGGVVDPDQQRGLDEIASKVVQYDRTGQYRIDLGNAYDHLPVLSAMHASGSILSRELRCIRAKLTSTERMAGWCDTLQRSWRLEIGRMRRARNAVAHGYGPPLRVAERAAPLAIQLASWALEESTAGTLTDARLRTLHEQLRDDSERWLRDVRKAPAVRTALTSA